MTTVVKDLARASAWSALDLLRVTTPFLGIGLFLAASRRGWVADPSWILLIMAALIAPLLVLERKRRDLVSIPLLVVAGCAGFALSGLPALAVLAPAWLLAALLSGRLLGTLVDLADAS